MSTYYLKLTDIPGECKDSGFEDQIKLHSWGWGGSNQANIGGSSGASGGTVSFMDVNFTKEMDKATPKLLKGITTGKSIGTGVITGVKSTGDDKPAPFIIFTMNEIYVTSYSVSGGTDAVPMETGSFAFGKVHTDYKMQDDAGIVSTAGEHGFDFRTKVTY